MLARVDRLVNTATPQGGWAELGVDFVASTLRLRPGIHVYLISMWAQSLVDWANIDIK